MSKKTIHTNARQIARSKARALPRTVAAVPQTTGFPDQARISGTRAACCVGVVSVLIAALASAGDLFDTAQTTAASASTATAEPGSGWSAENQTSLDHSPHMVWIPGGEFLMGSDDQLSRLNERPAHRVQVGDFWIDATCVTNAQFAKFIRATGYVTTAQQTPDWEELKKQLPPGTPQPDDSLLVPGSMVFVPTDGPVDLGNMANFWQWVPGASWLHPEGPHSNIQGREQHPVVQVSWDDAAAYAAWAGKSLPTEAQWEFAARGGLKEMRYAWGDEFSPNGRHMANIWNGTFPWHNTQDDGFVRTSPVKSFPANGYGLYDMAGNVWNWCADRYLADTLQNRTSHGTCCAAIDTQVRDDTQARDDTLVRDAALGRSSPADLCQPERVVKGGSYLCHPDYCASYRPSARRGLPADTGMSHVGFRCVSPDPKTAFQQ